MSKFDTHDLADFIAKKLEDAGYRIHRVGVPSHLQPPGCVVQPTYRFCWSGGAHEEFGEYRDSELAALADAFDHYFDLTIEFARAS